MHNHFFTASLLLTIGLVAPIQAQTTPPTYVDSAQQTTRDAEKLTILQAELTEQKQVAANLQQTRAVQLASNNKTELDKTEARLEEVNGNIAQLQQEIDVAQGKAKAVNTVVVKAVDTATKGDVKGDQTQIASPAGQWWDLYNRKTPVTK